MITKKINELKISKMSLQKNQTTFLNTYFQKKTKKFRTLSLGGKDSVQIDNTVDL